MKEIINQLASHNLLESIVEGVPIRIFWKDREGCYLGCNTLFAKDAGLAHPDELIGKSDFDMSWKDQAELYRSDDFSIMESGKSRLGFEEPQTTSDGKMIWLRTSKVPLRNDNREVIGILGIYEDISERKQIEIAAQRFRLALDNSADDIFLIDHKSMKFIDANETACLNMGYSLEELLDIGPSNIKPYVSIASLEETFHQVINQKSGFGIIETVHARKDGSQFPVEVRLKAFSEHGKTLLVAIARDISKRKEAEDELKLAKFVVDHAPFNITYLDSDARIRYINKTGCETLGYSQEELLKLSIPDIDPLFPIELWDKHWQKLKDNKSVPVNTVHRRKNGEISPVEVVANYIEFGDKAYNVAFDIDITERKQAEEALSYSESQFRNIIDASPIPYALNDNQHNITYLNPAFINTFGYDLQDIPTLEAWWPKAYPDENYRLWVTDRWQKHLQDSRKNGVTFEAIELDVCCKDGSTRTVLASAAPLENTSKGNHLVTLVDITEHKRSEALLEASRKKFAILFDHSNDSLFIHDMHANFIDVNQTACERLGYSKDELLHMKVSELDTPEFSAQVPQRIRQMTEHGKALFESAHIRKDGTIMSVEVSARIIELDGETVAFSTVRDISERKQLEEQLRQSQKMEAIGTLVGGIAHDFNNMLAAIQGNVYLAKRQMQDHPVAVDKLANIEQLGMHAAEMVQQLLTFARKDSVSMSVFSLNAFMNEGYLLAKAAIPENIDHQTSVCQEELRIQGDATQLQQVLINLLNNAVDAVADRTNPTIRCSLSPYSANKTFQKKHPGLTGKHLACISVIDNGHGIPDERLDKIFEPFFTTKEVGKGTGLGLAMLYGAVQTHGGVVEVDSSFDKGTDFRVYLPLSISNIESIGKKGEACSGGHSESILLVDDEQSVRSTTREVLSSMGYHILEASDGEQALEIYKTKANQIDLIISDIVMPRMGGTELLKEVRQLNKNLPFILVTGYDRDHVLKQDIGMKQCMVINKPFDFDSLSNIIQQMVRIS